MTNDEIAIALLARRGFVVIASATVREVGEILRRSAKKCRGPGGAVAQQTETPLRVVAGATCAEYNTQSRLITDITGDQTVPMTPEDLYFYRVEAAD